MKENFIFGDTGSKETEIDILSILNELENEVESVKYHVIGHDLEIFLENIKFKINQRFNTFTNGELSLICEFATNYENKSVELKGLKIIKNYEY